MVWLTNTTRTLFLSCSLLWSIASRKPYGVHANITSWSPCKLSESESQLGGPLYRRFKGTVERVILHRCTSLILSTVIRGAGSLLEPAVQCNPLYIFINETHKAHITHKYSVSGYSIRFRLITCSLSLSLRAYEQCVCSCCLIWHLCLFLTHSAHCSSAFKHARFIFTLVRHSFLL